MILPITLTIAGAAALINLWLGWRVSQKRLSQKIPLGDGGDAGITARMRAHANFVEYAPFVLILLGLIELAAGSSIWLWVVGVAFVLGRLLHAFGMDRPAPNPLRIVGILVTWIALLVLALYAVALPQLSARAEPIPVGARSVG